LSYYFVTGCNAAYLNTLLITLQSFATRLPDQRLLVCDYGLTPQQCEFLRRRGQLLGRPPGIPVNEHPYRCKAALLRYLENGGNKFGPEDTVIWLDADFTLLDVGTKDFAAVADEMSVKGIDVAACGNGLSIQKMCDFVGDNKMVPFQRALTFSGVDRNLPYYSIGIFFCRSRDFLKRWNEATRIIENHICFEQNMFTMILHRDRVRLMDLDMDEWQAQGASLEKIEIKTGNDKHPAAFIGQKNIKIIHTTSSAIGHVRILKAQMQVLDAVLNGIFKLLVKQDQFETQIDLLAGFIKAHRNDFLQLGICSAHPEPVGGFRFSPVSGFRPGEGDNFYI